MKLCVEAMLLVPYASICGRGILLQAVKTMPSCYGILIFVLLTQHHPLATLDFASVPLL
jgi:hypothetical protein